MRRLRPLQLILAFFIPVLVCAGSSTAVPPKVVAQFEPGIIEVENDGQTTEIPYRIRRPEDLTTDEPVPLIIFLHGAGSRGNDNQKQLGWFPEWWVTQSRLGGRHRAVIFAPQCPTGGRWASVATDAEGERQIDASLSPTVPMQAVMKKIKELVADPTIDASRVYLTGLSMGGFGSWDLTSRHPDWFAAVVPICGGGDPSFASRIADSGVPIWTVHGDADRVVPVDLTRTMVGAIRKADGRVGYTELPGVRHDSWKFAYGPEGLMEWMLAQQLPATPVKTPPADASGG